MRWLLAILEALAMLSAAYADPPRYVVTNRTTAQPAYTVVNKVGTGTKIPTPAERYAWVISEVEQGRVQVMIVGPHAPLHEYISKVELPSGFMGFADGVYDCFRQGSKAMMQKREEPADAHPFRPFQPGPSHSIPTTIAPSAVDSRTSSAGVVPYRAVIPTPARRAIRGITGIGSDGCTSYG